MLATILLGALAALAAPQASDTTFSAAGIERLQVSTQGGEIVVRSWNRNEVRVQASHSSRSRLEVDRSGSLVRLRVRGTPVPMADYSITVPARMHLDLSGLHADVRVEGISGDVEAKTVQGDVDVRGGRGRVRAQSVNGSVDVDGAQGEIFAKGVSGSVRLRNVAGNVNAESISGSVEVQGDARSVTATTVSGEVVYRGPLHANGNYFFSSHSGSVLLQIPRNADATFTIATLSGDLRAEGFTVQLPAGHRAGRRTTFTLGAGRAQVEAESFSGSIIISPVSQSGRN